MQSRPAIYAQDFSGEFNTENNMWMEHFFEMLFFLIRGSFPLLKIPSFVHFVH